MEAKMRVKIQESLLCIVSCCAGLARFSGFTRLRRANTSNDVERLLSVFGDVCKWTTETRDIRFVFVEQLETFLRIVQNRFELLINLIDTGSRSLSLDRRVRGLGQLGLRAGQNLFGGMTLDREACDAGCDFS